MLEYDIGLDGERKEEKDVVEEETDRRHVDGPSAVTLGKPCGKCIVR